MKRFIIIDHSLCNLQGHHYECSVSVAEAAVKLGYQSIIIANRTFLPELHPKEIKILPRFQVDWFDNPIVLHPKEDWRTKVKQNLTDLQEYSWESLREKLATNLQYKINFLKMKKPQSHLLLEKIEGSLTRLWQWIQKDIKLLTYIPLSNTFWGLFKIVWGLIRYLIQVLLNESIKLLDKYTVSRYESFRETLEKLFDELTLNSKDHILIHTLGISQVEDIYHLLTSRNNQDIPQFHLLLRRDTDEPLVTQAKGMGLTACFKAFADSQLWPSQVKFYTDTQKLLARYNDLSVVKLRQVPVPFRTEKLSLSPCQNQEDPIHLVYLGDARYEKGYHHLPEIVASLWEEYLSVNKIKFTIQSNFSVEGGEPGILPIRLQLEQYPSSKVKLIKEVMTTDDYYQILSSADIVILPYDPVNYRDRTSGVLTEALAAGKPVVVPNHTWLSRQIDETRGRVYDHPREIGDKIKEIIDHLKSFQAEAANFSLNWLQQNTPETFLKCLLSQPDFTPILDKIKETSTLVNINHSLQPQTRTKILYIIEGEEFIQETPQQQRCFQLWGYLFNCGYQVSLITFSKYPSYQQGNYEAFYYQVRNITNQYDFKDVWILDHNSYLSLPDDINYRLYLERLQSRQKSITQDLVNCQSVKQEDSLIQGLKQSSFDLIYVNSCVTVSLVKKLGISSSTIIGEIEGFLSYEYALSNQTDVDSLDFQKEVELLNQCSYLISSNPIEVEKLKEIVTSPQVNCLLSLGDSYSLQMNQLFQEVLGTKALSWNKSKNIAILYPWGDILEGKSGASKRVGLLTQYLKDREYHLWVFTTGEQKDFYYNDIRYSYYQQQCPEVNLVTDVYRDAYETWKEMSPRFNNGNIERDQDHWLPWIYYQFRFDKSFKEAITKIADWASIIILEYPFWAVTVGEICQQKSIKLIITAHDVLSQQLPENSYLRSMAVAEEIRGLKQANELVCVSLEDQAFFREYYLESSVIPNPVNLADFQTIDPLLIDDKTTQKLKQHFCLFVGSQHSSNIEAVAEIRQLAKLDVSTQFVIVGGCCHPEEKANFLALGKIPQETLIYLYQKASLIISPLLTGTGSSLKIIEAMAYGKVILGTPISFRGYSVMSPIHCIIEEDLSLYPKWIHELISQPDKLAIIGHKAKNFAKTYDYQIVYQTYDNLINKLSPEVG